MKESGAGSPENTARREWAHLRDDNVSSFAGASPNGGSDSVARYDGYVQ